MSWLRIHLTFRDLTGSTSLIPSTNKIWRIWRVGAWMSSGWVSCGQELNPKRDSTIEPTYKQWKDWCLWLETMASTPLLSSIRTCSVRNSVQMVSRCGPSPKPSRRDSHCLFPRRHHLTRPQDFRIGIPVPNTHGENSTLPLPLIKVSVLFTTTGISFWTNLQTTGSRSQRHSKTIHTSWPMNL